MGLFFVSGETPATVVDGRFWLGELCEGTVSETLKYIKRPKTASQVSGQMGCGLKFRLRLNGRKRREAGILVWWLLRK